MKTKVSIQGESFLINGRPVYAEIPGHPPAVEGLLMNARFIQGIFDDKADPERFARFGWANWDPDRNTDGLIAALPDWHGWGLRAFTVGFQGGGPVYTTDNSTIDNNPFGALGTELDPAYARRMDRLIRAADAAGMVVIVSYLYQGQQKRLRDGAACRSAVAGASRFLKEGGYTNVLIEVANEYPLFGHHPIVGSAEGMASLIDLARRESGGLPVASSGGGGDAHREVCEASDFILIHGNGLNRQQYSNLIARAREYSPGKPVVCNEDSPCIGQLDVAFQTRSSWGYYNNLTKQEPPADWGITASEDLYFAHRMASGLGIKKPPLSEGERYRLLGLEPRWKGQAKRWIRVGSLEPETIRFVEFFLDGKLMDRAFEPFHALYYETTWLQKGWTLDPSAREWLAKVQLVDGRVLELRGTA